MTIPTSYKLRTLRSVYVWYEGVYVIYVYGESNMVTRTFGSCEYVVRFQLCMSYSGSMYAGVYGEFKVDHNNIITVTS